MFPLISQCWEISWEHPEKPFLDVQKSFCSETSTVYVTSVDGAQPNLTLLQTPFLASLGPYLTLVSLTGPVPDPWTCLVGWTCLVSSCAQGHTQGWGCLSAPSCLASGWGGGNGPGCQVLPFPAALGSPCWPQTPESSCPMKHSDFKNLKVRCVKVQPNSVNAVVLKVVGIQICFAWQGLFGVQSVLGEKVYGNWRVPSEKKWHYSDEKNAIWLFRLSFWLWGTLTVWEEWVWQFHCCRIWKSFAGDPNCVRSS